MRARLLFPDRDFVPQSRVASHQHALERDLGLDTILTVMAAGDAFVHDACRKIIAEGAHNDVAVVRYRQAVLEDCMAQSVIIRELYDLAVEGTDAPRRLPFYGLLGKTPSSMLSSAVSLLEVLLDTLRRLRAFADLHAAGFRSAGLVAVFDSVRQELDDAYLAEVARHLTRLRFRRGVLLSAELGQHNEGRAYTLRVPESPAPNWWQRALGLGAPGFTIRIPDRDEAGARALGDIESRGLVRVAAAASQSAAHVMSFFQQLRTELALYVGALNLRDRLAAIGAEVSLPAPAAAGSHALHFRGLHDPALSLALGRQAIANDLDVTGVRVIVVTGANQGGKSTYLRSLGLAQVMMQAGLFVAARSFSAELCTGVFTHFPREEDAALQHGKLDEELARLSGIVDALRPGSMLLMNESFASTNQREGSELARQAVRALAERLVAVRFVTHLHEFARQLFEQRRDDVLFLRAERLADGSRSFRIVPGEPLETSFGTDLYAEVFGVPRDE
jgi:DNA mismatch repair ATPase MutS